MDRYNAHYNEDQHADHYHPIGETVIGMGIEETDRGKFYVDVEDGTLYIWNRDTLLNYMTWEAYEQFTADFYRHFSDILVMAADEMDAREHKRKKLERALEAYEALDTDQKYEFHQRRSAAY